MLAESGSPLRLPASLSSAQMLAGGVGRSGSTGLTGAVRASAPAQQRQPLMSLNRTPGQAAPGIKQEAAEEKVHAYTSQQHTAGLTILQSQHSCALSPKAQQQV